jgi:hypothetical protein
LKIRTSNVEKIEKLLVEAKNIKSMSSPNPAYKSWRLQIEILITELFGANSEYLKHFKTEANRVPPVVGNNMQEFQQNNYQAFLRKLENLIGIVGVVKQAAQELALKKQEKKNSTTQVDFSKKKKSKGKLKIFLSYSTKDRGYVGKFKKMFEEKYGIQSFLAHEDMSVSDQWKQRIVKELNDADVYVPVLTGHFRNSDWTGQEAGIAIGRGILIASLWVTEKPYGFLADHHAGKTKLNKADEACAAVVDGILKNETLRPRLVDGFIEVFLKSGSWQTTNEFTERLEKMGNFNKGQITKLVKGASENKEIYGAEHTKQELFDFVERHKRLLDTSSWNKFFRKFKN